jgi:inosose dehydratase
MTALRIGNAPCSWGVMSGFDPASFPPYQQVLSDIAETGYEGTELGDWGFLPKDPETLASALSEHRLSMIGALVPIPLADPASHAPGRAAALRTAHLLSATNVGDRTNLGRGLSPDSPNAPFIILADANGTNSMRTANAGRIRPENGLSDHEWKTFARGATTIARAVLDETGLRTVFHHHCAGFIETPEETARLIDMTPPDLIGLCFDTGHWAYAGGDALDGLRTYRERIWHVHFKDCHADVAEKARAEQWDYYRALENQIYYGLGTGDIDFQTLVTALQQSSYAGWIVVEDELPPGMGDPRASAQRDREYVRSLGL